jgi:hypothetical protein
MNGKAWLLISLWFVDYCSNKSGPAINYNYKILMFDSNYPSNKKRNTHFEDTTYLPTAERSHYLERTPNRQQQLTSPLNHSNNKVASLQRSIEEVI